MKRTPIGRKTPAPVTQLGPSPGILRASAEAQINTAASVLTQPTSPAPNVAKAVRQADCLSEGSQVRANNPNNGLVATNMGSNSVENKRIRLGLGISVIGYG